MSFVNTKHNPMCSGYWIPHYAYYFNSRGTIFYYEKTIIIVVLRKGGWS